MLVKTFCLFILFYYFLVNSQSCFFLLHFMFLQSDRIHHCMRSPKTPPPGGFHPKFFLVCTLGHSSLP